VGEEEEEEDIPVLPAAVGLLGISMRIRDTLAM